MDGVGTSVPKMIWCMNAHCIETFLSEYKWEGCLWQSSSLSEECNPFHYNSPGWFCDVMTLRNFIILSTTSNQFVPWSIKFKYAWSFVLLTWYINVTSQSFPVLFKFLSPLLQPSVTLDSHRLAFYGISKSFTFYRTPFWLPSPLKHQELIK